MFERACGANPVANLGASGIELLARQGLQRPRVLLAKRPNELAVERLVDGEVTEPARRHNADAQAFRVTLDRLANSLAELVAAPGRRLVGRIIRIEENRDDRDRHALPDTTMDEAERLPLPFPLGQRIGGGHVEVAVDQRRDEMVRELRMDR